jgi:hypothetical protein
MVMIITTVDAMTMRATRAVLPGYGASSSLKKSQNQVAGWGRSDKCWMTVAMPNFCDDLQQSACQS